MDAIEYVKLFVLGIVFMALTTTQHINSSKGRYLLAFPTSLLLSMFIWINISFAVNQDVNSFRIFSLGAAAGASIGIWWGHRKRND